MGTRRAKAVAHETFGQVPASIQEYVDKNNTKKASCSVPEKKGTTVLHVNSIGEVVTDTAKKILSALPKSKVESDNYYVEGYAYINDVPMDKKTREAMRLEDQQLCQAIVHRKNVGSFMRYWFEHPPEGMPEVSGRAYPSSGNPEYFLCVIYKTLAGFKYFERFRLAEQEKNIPCDIFEEIMDKLWTSEKINEQKKDAPVG
jgi:hypothetical protein